MSNKVSADLQTQQKTTKQRFVWIWSDEITGKYQVPCERHPDSVDFFMVDSVGKRRSMK